MMSETPDAQHKPLGLWQVLAVAIGASIVTVSLAGLAAYKLSPPPMKFATLDLPSIVEDQQLVFTSTLMDNPSIGAAEAGVKAVDAVNKFARDLDEGVDRLRKECGCLLLTGAAVIGEPALDLTPQLRLRLGLDKVDRVSLQKRIAAGMTPVIPKSSDSRPADPTAGGLFGSAALRGQP